MAHNTLQQPLGYYAKTWMVHYPECDFLGYLAAQQVLWYLAQPWFQHYWNMVLQWRHAIVMALKWTARWPQMLVLAQQHHTYWIECCYLMCSLWVVERTRHGRHCPSPQRVC